MDWFFIYVGLDLSTFAKKMAAKSTTPSNEQMEIDQMAEAELERLQKQV